MRPQLQKVDVPPGELDDALDRLERLWERPDGAQLIGARAVSAVRKQLRQGYYYRLVFPGMTAAQAVDWHRHAEQIVEWHRLGLL